MAARLQAANGEVEQVILRGVGHGWIGGTPEATRAGSLRALELTFAFFEKLARRP